MSFTKDRSWRDATWQNPILLSGQTFALATGNQVANKEAKGNANLAKLAPELLAALEQCRYHLRSLAPKDGHANGTLQLLNRLIKEANDES